MDTEERKLCAEKLRGKGISTDDEHCVIYAMFPQQVEDFYKKPEPKTEAPIQVNTTPAPAPAMTVIDNGITAQVSGPAGSRDLTIIVNGQPHPVKVERVG